MTKHTPGPWKVAEREDYKLFGAPELVSAIEALNPHGTGDEWIAEALTTDARLIAAAPELLEALQETVIQLEEWRDISIFNGVPSPQTHANSIEVNEQSRAAIRLASPQESEIGK